MANTYTVQLSLVNGQVFAEQAVSYKVVVTNNGGTAANVKSVVARLSSGNISSAFSNPIVGAFDPVALTASGGSQTYLFGGVFHVGPSQNPATDSWQASVVVDVTTDDNVFTTSSAVTTSIEPVFANSGILPARSGQLDLRQNNNSYLIPLIAGH